MTAPTDGIILRVDKLVFFINALAQYAAELYQLTGSIMFQPFKVFLWINDRIKISTVRDIHYQLAQLRAFNGQLCSSQVARYIREFDGSYFSIFFCIRDHDQPCRGFHPYNARRFRYHQFFFNGNGNGADGSMPAHRQAAAGFYEQHGHIVLWIMRWIQNTPAHHVVATGLKHKPGAYPVVFFEEVLALFAHIHAVKRWPAFLYQAYGISAGMGINTGKNMGHFLRFRCVKIDEY